MMNGALPSNSPGSADPAVARVLEAEHLAHAEVERCARQAAAIVKQAHAAAAAVEERTARRVKRMDARMEAATAQRLARIDEESAALADDANLDAETLSHLDTAIAHLVAELLGEG